MSAAPTAPETPEAEADDGLVRALPDTLASKIAAGEVVQRPASVVKETVENALDAGASSVELIVKRAGSELIQVVDDGGGMGPRDAVACFGRHATSKLRAFEDLEHLRTLGFRGEALASIGAVARIDLRTRRRQDDTAVRVRVEGGDVAEPVPVAAQPGTNLAVRDLFYNVPARRAFLRSPATEFKHIVETFQALALSHPAVAFRLVHDEMEVYRLPAADERDPQDALCRRVVDLLGSTYAGKLVPVQEATSYLSVRGVVGAPEVARKSRGDQYLFVNGRYVRSRSLEHAAAQAFGALLPEGRRPFLALFLDVDPRHVDVNVHPTKTEVKFDDERGVYSFVRAVVKKGLAEAGLALDLAATSPEAVQPFAPDALSDATGGPRGDGETPTAGLPALPSLPETSAGPPAGLPPLPRLPGAEPRAPHAFRLDPGPRDAEPDAPALPAPDRSHDVARGEGPDPFGPGSRVPVPAELRVPIPSRADTLPAEVVDRAGFDETVRAPERTVWPYRGRYLLSPVASGLLVVHLRAAHERILYEKALAVLEGGMGLSQQLLFPYTLDLSAADLALLRELEGELRALGFEIAIADTAVEVRGVPADVGVEDQQVALTDLLDRYRLNADTLRLASRDNLARSLARRTALRDARTLSPVEARALIDQLFACDDPFRDPSGQPTMIRIADDELEQRFSR